MAVNPEKFDSYHKYKKAKDKSESMELDEKIKKPFNKMIKVLWQDAVESKHIDPTKITKEHKMNPENTWRRLTKNDKFVFAGAPAEIINLNKTKGEVRLKTRIGEKTYKKRDFIELLRGEEIQTQAENLETNKKTTEKIAQYIKFNGIDRVVVHGEPRYTENPDTGEGEPVKSAELDFDTEVALYFLNYNQDFTSSDTVYNTGASTEFVMKGEKSSFTNSEMAKNGKERKTPLKKGALVLHIDTGENNLSIEKAGQAVAAYADHHKEIDNIRTSAAEMVFNIMTEAEAYKPEPWMRQVVRFVNEVDNLSYADKKNFTPGYFQEIWPKTLYALHKFLPYKQVINWIREGRNPENPFTETELDTLTVETNATIKNKETGKYEKKQIPLRELVNVRGKHAFDSMKYLNAATRNMSAQHIKQESKELGRVAFATMDSEVDIRGNKISGTYLKEGYLAAKAKGYDTYVSYSQSNDRFFINSTNKDLRPIIKEVKKIVPNAKLIRGVMILPGKDGNGGKLTKEKLLEICGLMDKDTMLYKYDPKPKILSPKAQAFQKDKERTSLEREIADLEKRIREKMKNIKILQEGLEINKAYNEVLDEEIKEIDTNKREKARVEENEAIKETLSRARKLLNTKGVKPDEALTIRPREEK